MDDNHRFFDGSLGTAKEVKLGRCVFHPIFLGQDCVDFQWKQGLGSDCYYVGEAVCVVRSNGRRTVGQIAAIKEQHVIVKCGGGTEKDIPMMEVPTTLRKYKRACYLVNGLNAALRRLSTGRGTPDLIQIGETTLKPLLVGQIHSGCETKAFPIELYGVGEPVVVLRGDGRRTIGEIKEVACEGMVVVVEEGWEKPLSANDVPTYIQKLLGSFYVARVLPRSSPPHAPGNCCASLSSSQVVFAKPTTLLPEPPQSQTAKQIDDFLRQQNHDEVEEVFNRHAQMDACRDLFIPKEGIHAALGQLNIKIDPKTVDEFFLKHDVNGDGKIDLEEFKSAVSIPSPVEDWAQSLNLPRLLAYALPQTTDGSDDKHDGSEHLRAISKVNEAGIELVADEFCKALRKLLKDHVTRLRNAFEKLDQVSMGETNEKFHIVKMDNCGNVEDFHSGLQGRIGPCNMEFMVGMESEHCSKGGCDREFKTQNFEIVTSPRMEWSIIVEKKPCPVTNMREGRQIPDIEELMELEVAKKSNLTKPEVIALVLYTGPMYHVYNTVLRRVPLDEYEVYKKAKNFFPTTISVIVSAVLNICRAVKLPEGLRLYRGLGGSVDLPDSFFKGDGNGFNGFVEWAFMSTTSKKDVAIKYSGVQDNKPVPIILSIRVGTVDRGACIRDFSQFQSEVEYLYVPCSFLQQEAPQYLEITPTGVLKIYPIRVNTNFKSLTLDEQLGQKKKMHIAAFNYLIDEIGSTCHRIATQAIAQERLASDPSKDDKHTLEGFVARMVDQCRDVLARHQAVHASEYSKHHVYQSLVLEMVDVKAMAESKLLEWIENHNSSFIRFRWNAALRTVHRRWIAYLERTFSSCSEGDNLLKQTAIRLCKATKLIVESADETNELGETRLMAAAAEGLGMRKLRWLVAAGASVKFARPDGVTPVWLAAQFGHAESIQALHDLNANVQKAANDGATPVYIAAQNGNCRCIETLKELGADVTVADEKGMTPLHQAAMNGWEKCIEILLNLKANVNQQDQMGRTALHEAALKGHAECAAKLLLLGANKSLEDAKGKTAADQAQTAEVKQALFGTLATIPSLSPAAIAPTTQKTRRLIISTGDISDVDGFLALAEYAKTGADVLFIMNYPAYIGVSSADPAYENEEVRNNYADYNPGLGYKYSAKEVFERDNGKAPDKYKTFMENYPEHSDNDKMKSAMTDLAFWIAKGVWHEASKGSGNLLFCIGGINAVNPFSCAAIKNEVLVYSTLIPKPSSVLETKEGTIYGSNLATVQVQWSEYSDVFIDFNGSMAFWNDAWQNKLSEAAIVSKIRGAFIMGGVYAKEAPATMPSIANVLNRFSSATMNQLYHPQKAAEFFAFLKQNHVPAYTVTNNEVGDLTSYGADGKTRTFEGVETFMTSNDLSGPFLRDLAKTHYNSKYNPPRKAFDYHPALAIAQKMGDIADSKFKSCPRTLFFSNVYGITFVSNDDTWPGTRLAYISKMDVVTHPDDNPFIQARKSNFAKEIEMMKHITHMDSLAVFNLQFAMDENKKLSIKTE